LKFWVRNKKKFKIILEYQTILKWPSLPIPHQMLALSIIFLQHSIEYSYLLFDVIIELIKDVVFLINVPLDSNEAKTNKKKKEVEKSGTNQNNSEVEKSSDVTKDNSDADDDDVATPKVVEEKTPVADAKSTAEVQTNVVVKSDVSGEKPPAGSKVATEAKKIETKCEDLSSNLVLIYDEDNLVSIGLYGYVV